jgi:chromosome segregation ATPase
MEWTEGRISKRSVDSAKAPEPANATTKQSYAGVDELELASAREKILQLKHEVEALKAVLSLSSVERLKAELSVCYATNRGVRRQLEDEMEENGRLSAELRLEREANEKVNARLTSEKQENEKLNTELKHVSQENEKLVAELKREREENEKLIAELNCEKEHHESLDAELKLAVLANGNLLELSRSLTGQADGLRAILGIVADRLERWPCLPRLPELVDGDDVREQRLQRASE